MSADPIPEDIMKSAEEALDNMLCNCKESCGGTYDGVRAESIKDIAFAILAERNRCIAFYAAKSTERSDRAAKSSIDPGAITYL